MPAVKIRKTIIQLEEIHHEGGPVAGKPLLRGSIMAVIENPYAGSYVEDISGFMDDLRPLGLEMAQKLLAAMQVSAADIEGYGKGSIVGSGGEIEHGALWHNPGGYAMREVLNDTKAIVPSTKKVGAAGTRLDVPISHINASYVRSHFDAIEVGTNDAPRNNELVFVLAMTTGSRIHARTGGLSTSEIKGEDGLR